MLTKEHCQQDFIYILPFKSSPLLCLSKYTELFLNATGECEAKSNQNMKMFKMLLYKCDSKGYKGVFFF